MERTGVQIIGVACRNCLSKWYAEAAAEAGEPMSKEAARELVYGMPYDEWKTKFQTPRND